MLHFVLHDSSNPSTNNPLYLNNLHRFFHPLYLYISFYRPYIVCRVDEDGNINNDHAIHLRAQRAAEKVARQRGWTTAMHIHERNIPQVSADRMEALRELDEWSWDGYKSCLPPKATNCICARTKRT